MGDGEDLPGRYRLVSLELVEQETRAGAEVHIVRSASDGTTTVQVVRLL